jgi:hypothetical protein
MYVLEGCSITSINNVLELLKAFPVTNRKVSRAVSNIFVFMALDLFLNKRRLILVM